MNQFPRITLDHCRREVARCLVRRLTLLVAFAFVVLAGLLTSPQRLVAQSNDRLNVVLVMTDDQGYGDVGAHGNSMIQTPHLDALARQSIRFTNFHVDPTCSETRSALMTGRYSSRVGVWHTIMGRSILRKDELTMADVFASNGYRTGIFGKWHLGDNWPYRPQDRGFQETLVHGGGGVGQTPDYWGNDYFDDTYFRNGEPEPQEGYCTDVFFRAALKFIEQNRDRPFFCYIPTNAPHGPYNVDPKYSRPYEEKGVPQPMANFYGMITNIDENVGRLLEKLDQWQLADRTLVIFMTDNGTAAGVARRKVEGKWAGFNAGMRGTKGSQYEGGHRVPCFFHGPGWLSGSDSHREIAHLAAHFDLLPTLVDLCNLKLARPIAFDGRSLEPLLRGESNWPERTLFVHSQRVEHPEKWRKCSVMTERWRLVDGKELYDIKKDPGQTTSVADDQPAIVRQLRTAYERWWQSISERFDEYVAIPLGADQANPTNLTCHDWHGQQVPWNQQMIQRTPAANGFWAVEVVQDGTYRFTLRSRPRGVAFSFQSGTARVQVGDAKAESPIAAGSSEVQVEMPLKAGLTRLQTWIAEEGKPERGAFYVEVERLR